MLYGLVMGTCFGCCCPMTNNQRKQSQRFLFLKSTKTFEVLNNDHEMLELEQRSGSASRTKGVAGGIPSSSAKFTRFKFRKTPICWLGKDCSVTTGTLNNPSELLSPIDAMMPLLRRDSSFADSCSQTGSQGWEHLGSGATPGSSVDLEWENEIGLTPPPNALAAHEELNWMGLTTETTTASWQSSPISNGNGLEWDGDFTSVDISGIITETQNLISELDEKPTQTMNVTNANS